MEKQIFFFDIDVTLVDSTTHIVPKSTKLALKALKQQGHIICISTGRSLQSVCDSKFDQLADWDIFLCNNGQAIYNAEKELLFSKPITQQSVNACIDVANKQNVPLFIMTENDQLLTKQPNDHVIISSAFFKEQIPEVKPYHQEPVIMMIAYGPMGYAYDEYKAIDGIDILPGQSTYADVVLKGFHKGIGIQFILEHFHMKEYIAFGDSLNDVEMLKNARIGIAMGNGDEEVKKHGDYITEDVSDDGIYKALQHFQILP